MGIGGEGALVRNLRVWRRTMVALTLFASLFVTGVGIGHAATYWSSYRELWRSPGSWCFYVRENYKDPASNPAYDFDFNSWHYMRQYNSGCSPYNNPQAFGY